MFVIPFGGFLLAELLEKWEAKWFIRHNTDEVSPGLGNLLLNLL